MSQLLVTPFMRFAFQWDVLVVFALSAGAVMAVIVGGLTWLFRGIRWF